MVESTAKRKDSVQAMAKEKVVVQTADAVVAASVTKEERKRQKKALKKALKKQQQAEQEKVAGAADEVVVAAGAGEGRGEDVGSVKKKKKDKKDKKRKAEGEATEEGTTVVANGDCVTEAKVKTALHMYMYSIISAYREYSSLYKLVCSVTVTR